MLSPGGPAERTRGLDLWADDVLSLPFDPQELRSRVRSQLRNKSIADQFRERLRLAEELPMNPWAGTAIRGLTFTPE